jgi:hypothetical protein
MMRQVEGPVREVAGSLGEPVEVGQHMGSHREAIDTYSVEEAKGRGCAQSAPVEEVARLA